MTQTRKRRPPASTPDERENQLIAEAINLAEKQIMEGTASAQVITHYLRLGSSKARLENEKLRRENELLKAKTEALESQKDMKKIYSEALAAMRTYSGQEYEVTDD